MTIPELRHDISDGLPLTECANGYPVPGFAQAPAQHLPINITTQLQVDGRVLAEVVNEANSQSAARGPQGGPH